MLVTCLDESLGAWDYYWGWFCSCYNLVRFVHVRVRVSLCVCVAFDRCWQFKFVFASFIYITLFSILPLFMLLYSSPVLEPNPVLNLAPPSTIVSNRLTWSVTNRCVCLSQGRMCGTCMMARLVLKLATKTSPVSRNANLPSVWSRNIRKSTIPPWVGAIAPRLWSPCLWMVVAVLFCFLSCWVVLWFHSTVQQRVI